MDWLNLARDAFTSSTSYAEANWQKDQLSNQALFANKHAPGSKYHSDNYKFRSKIFRPKTRSAVRKTESAGAAAFFSNMDVVSIDAQDDSNDRQRASAAIMKEIMNYRLTKTLPWFKLLIGALQEAQVYGVIVSYQYWMAESVDEDVIQSAIDPVTRQPVQIKTRRKRMKHDKPCIELVPIENFRIDPGADWLDPINSSPYLIQMIPMYIGDVKQMMGRVDEKTGQPTWKTLDDKQLMSAKVDTHPLRTQREGVAEDGKSESRPISDFDMVWVHRNIIRHDGDDVVYYTLGTEALLSTPKPLEEVYAHGIRPYSMGSATIEAHKIMPESIVALGSEMQKELNEIVNQRLDNVKLVLNKRWLAKRNGQVDTQSLLRNVPGSVTMVNDIADVQEVNWPDVTSSSYQEQDRINVEFDELVGNFSSGSVQSNRSLNETVGGMNMLQSGSNQLTEYLLRTFTETWVEDCLRQLVKLEQYYETDAVILAMAAGKAELLEKYGINQVTDDLLNQELTTTVNVGMGSTDAKSRVEKFQMAVQTYAMARQAMPDANPEAVRKEVFGLLGYKGGGRFFTDAPQSPDAKLQAELQKMGKEVIAMHSELMAMKSDRTVDAYKAETDRIKAVAPLLPPEAGVVLAAQQLAQISTSTDIDPGQPQQGPQEVMPEAPEQMDQPPMPMDQEPPPEEPQEMPEEQGMQ